MTLLQEAKKALYDAISASLRKHEDELSDGYGYYSKDVDAKLKQVSDEVVEIFFDCKSTDAELQITAPKPLLRFGNYGFICPHCRREIGLTVRVCGGGGGGTSFPVPEGRGGPGVSKQVGDGAPGAIEIITEKFKL